MRPSIYATDNDNPILGVKDEATHLSDIESNFVLLHDGAKIARKIKQRPSVQPLPRQNIAVMFYHFFLTRNSDYNLALQFSSKEMNSEENIRAFLNHKRQDYNSIMGGTFMMAFALHVRGLGLEVRVLFMCGTIMVAFVANVSSVGIYENLWDTERTPLTLLGFLTGFTFLNIESTSYRIQEEWVVFCSTFCTNIYLLVMVLTDCPTSVSALKTINCIPYRNLNRLPYDQILLIFVVILAHQKFFSGASKIALSLSWMITAANINICLHIVNSKAEYIQMNLVMFIFILVSYEVERKIVQQFLQMKSASEMTRKLFDFELMVARKEASDIKRDLDSKRSMVRHISHEIRTPLNTISIGVEVLTHELSNFGNTIPKSLVEMVDGIREASCLALVTLNELLTYEKLAAGLYSVELAATYVLDIVQSVMKEFHIHAIGKDITFIQSPTNSQIESATVNIDSVKMAIVIRNIFSNAMKFTPQGGEINVIVAYPCLTKGAIAISVKDSGVGLSQENVKNLFQEGVQFNANTLQGGGGSGFGLYISKKIVELHKGSKIWATSEGEGMGCEFGIDLPVTFRRNSYAESSCTIPSMDQVDHSISSFNILVVDDSKGNRKMVVKLLEMYGYSSVEVVDGLAAVREISLMLMKREGSQKTYAHYDAVLMDSCMPKMGGPEATVEMRKLGFKGPIIGITGNEDVEDFKRAGANLVMLKPVNGLQLSTGLKNTLMEMTLMSDSFKK